MKSHFRYERDEEPIIPPPSTSDVIPRRIDIKREDVSEPKYGLTPGCRGCEAANRGSTGIHNETCRKMIELAIFLREPDRYNRVLEKISTLMEEDLSNQPTPAEEDETSSSSKRRRTSSQSVSASSTSQSAGAPPTNQLGGASFQQQQ